MDIRESNRAVSLRHYILRCQGCRTAFEDDGLLLECPMPHEPALLATEYRNERFQPDPHAKGMFRYRRWLPGGRVLSNSGGSVTYKSERLNRAIRLTNLWVVFNGYWPEKGATLETTTFKDLEASAVLSRIPESNEKVLVIASAGNTATAFARACSLNRVPCLVIVPEAALTDLRFARPIDPCVKVISLTGFTDYFDAIALADRVSRLDGFFPEGGAKNVARRDGLSTAVLNAVETIGQIPSYYFQAVASGTGAIATYEAAERLVGDGRFGESPPRLMLSQNLPFVPIYTSWKTRRRELVEIDEANAKEQSRQIVARVLSNRRPPYATLGGIFDTLVATRGDVLVADNHSTLRAKRLFEETEGVDIDPAGAVALATLIEAVRRGEIERDAPVLLNITGGGRLRQRREEEQTMARPDLELGTKELRLDKTLERIVGLFG